MSVAGILSTAAMSIGAQFFQSRAQQMKQDFQQLGSDLQSGNLSAAQSDFAALQKLQPQSTSSSPTQSTSTLSQDWNQLATDLKAGNTTAAQQDFAKIQQDFQSQSSQTHGRHHHHGGDSSNSSEISQLFTQLGSALNSGNLSAAQQAYSTMLQDFTQSASTSASTTNSLSLSA